MCKPTPCERRILGSDSWKASKQVNKIGMPLPQKPLKAGELRLASRESIPLLRLG